MKYIKKIIISSDQFNDFCKKNKNIEIKELEIKDDFFISSFKNKDFIIKSKIENLSYFLLYNHKKDLVENDIQKLEDIIKNNSKYSYDYAENVIKGPFEKGEEAISETPDTAYKYAKGVIKGVWSKGHQAISRKPIFAAMYAVFLNKRWKDITGVDKKTAYIAETSIIKNDSALFEYIKEFFNGQRWLEAEKYLLKNYIDSKSIVSYAQKIIKGRWPEGEKILLSLDIYDDSYLPHQLYVYALNVIKGPWPEVEHVIFKDTLTAVEYATDITKKRIPKEIEDKIANYRDVSIAIDYAADVYKKRWPEYERNLLKIKNEFQAIIDTFGDGEDYPEDIAFVHIETIIDQYKDEVIKGPWPEAEIRF